MADAGRTVLQAARDHELSWPIANAAFIAHAETVLPASTPAVKHLGIDETRRGKAKFRLVTGADGAEEAFACSVLPGYREAIRWISKQSESGHGFSMFELASHARNLAAVLSQTEPRHRGQPG